MYTEEDLRQGYLQFLVGLYLYQIQVDYDVELPDIEDFRPIFEEVMEDLMS
jgi:hypothetical protein